MKKINTLFFIITLFILTNCSNSKKDKEYEQAAKQDSINISDSAMINHSVDLKTNTPKNKQFIKTAEIKFKVHNVSKATEDIEDLSAKYDGYIVSSELKNDQTNYEKNKISRDSFLECKQITVLNEIKLRIPNEKLDSFVRSLNKMILFLDYRNFKLEDVTYNFLKNKKITERISESNKRQIRNIDSSKSKLKDKTNAEESILNKQIMSDAATINNLELEDKIKFCDIQLIIYQKPITIKETIENFNYFANSKPSFFHRIMDAIYDGWSIFEEIIIFMFRIWGVILLFLIIIIVYKKFIRKNKS